jgi:uncharacterized protein DUF2630
MEDPQIHSSIDRMVDEEHQLWQRESAGEATDADRQRLEELRVSLDQCWDLLRQRRARRDAGQSPEGAELRSPEVVERYQQ